MWGVCVCAVCTFHVQTRENFSSKIRVVERAIVCTMCSVPITNLWQWVRFFCCSHVYNYFISTVKLYNEQTNEQTEQNIIDSTATAAAAAVIAEAVKYIVKPPIYLTIFTSDYGHHCLRCCCCAVNGCRLAAVVAVVLCVCTKIALNLIYHTERNNTLRRRLLNVNKWRKAGVAHTRTHTHKSVIRIEHRITIKVMTHNDKSPSV